jgi:membrane-associated protein
MEQYIISHTLQYRYFFLAILAIFEGPVVMMISGFLLKLGYISFFPAYIALMAGDLAGDVGWYALGYYGSPIVRRFGKYVSITDEKVKIIERIFHSHRGKILFLSKITMGFGFALVTLVTAGLVRIPFRWYFGMNMAGQIVWTAFLMLVGFVFGGVYMRINAGLNLASSIALIVIAFALLFGFAKYVRSRMIKNV